MRSSRSCCCSRVVLGGAAYWGKQRFEEPGPAEPGQGRQYSARVGVRDIGEMLAREGVIRDPWVFIGGAAAMKARGADLKFGEYQFAEGRKPARRRRHHDRRQGGAASIHGRRRTDLGADRRAAAGERQARPAISAKCRAKASLLPDGYRFTRGTARDEMIKRMQAGAGARAQGSLGPARARSAGHRLRNSSWCWPRSSRRKPASRTSARASRRCSSTG